ncbi:MAG: PTS sugar transporter subunit IIC [Erysipelotrichaceae bacterium]|nr:PTS sugar transporter subunit IIC [Erysipelotrichaceae bacterium]
MGDFSIVQILLVGVVGFIAGIDQFSFLESLYRPIVLGPIVGAILGQAELGLKIGASYELMMVGNMPIGGAQPPNVVVGGIMAVVFAISTGTENFESALGLAVPFAVLGQQAVTIMFTITSPLMSKADDMAAKADVKGIERLNLMTMCGIGLLFAVISMAGVAAGSALGDWMASNVPAWIWTGLGAAGGMMKHVGFAVLMKIMISGETWAFLFVGFGLATIIDKLMPGQTLILVAIFGIAMAIYDFQLNTKYKNAAGQGGMSDGI